jgi:hypothetical protein
MVSLEQIREKLNVLRIYLTILIASLSAGLVWLSQNFGNASTLNITLVSVLTIVLFLCTILIKLQIQKLIDML